MLYVPDTDDLLRELLCILRKAVLHVAGIEPVKVLAMIEAMYIECLSIFVGKPPADIVMAAHIVDPVRGIGSFALLG